MTTALLGIVLLAALFAAFGFVQRERRCDGACPGCGSGCSHWIAPDDRRDMEVDRVGK
jgi:hypothetical protein